MNGFRLVLQGAKRGTQLTIVMEEDHCGWRFIVEDSSSARGTSSLEIDLEADEACALGRLLPRGAL